MSKKDIRDRLLKALMSGDLQRRYEEARKEHSALLAELEASKGPIDPLLLITPVTL